MLIAISWADHLFLFAVSLAANMLSAFAGGGAVRVRLHALILRGLPFGVALATHKVATVALGIGATTRHLRQCGASLRSALFSLVGGVPVWF